MQLSLSFVKVLLKFELRFGIIEISLLHLYQQTIRILKTQPRCDKNRGKNKMKTLRKLIERVKNGEIYTNDYVALQDAAFEIATKKVAFGQDRHSEPGTPNKFIVEIPEAIEAEGHEYKSITFVDDSNAIYLNLDFETALECAELDGWFKEYSKLNPIILDSIIFANKKYVEVDGRSTEEYHLTDFEECPGGWDCLFPNCPSWDELDEYHREYRREVIKEALSNY